MSKKLMINYCDEDEMMSVIIKDKNPEIPNKIIFYGNNWDLPNDAHSLKEFLDDIGDVVGFDVEINEVKEEELNG